MPVKRQKAAAAPSPALLAMQLLGRWTKLSQGHVALSLGCSCGVGAPNLRVQDFEEQILEFLRGKHGGNAGSIAELLTGIARAGDAAAAPQSLRLLADLERSVESFEQQHSGR